MNGLNNSSSFDDSDIITQSEDDLSNAVASPGSVAVAVAVARQASAGSAAGSASDAGRQGSAADILARTSSSDSTDNGQGLLCAMLDYGQDSAGKRKHRALSQNMCKIWSNFCQHQSIPEDQHSFPILIDDNGNLNIKLSRLFINYLSDTNTSGYNQMKAGMEFLAYHAKTQCSYKGVAYNATALSSDLPIKNVMNQWKTQKAFFAKKNKLDLQAIVNPRINDSDQLKFLEICLDPPSNHPLVAKHPSIITWLQVGALFLDTKSTLQRGMECRVVTLNTLFLEDCPYVGPNGTQSYMGITNQSKTNHAGKLQHSANVPHVDPMFDAVAWKGLVWFFRLLACNEPLPCFHWYGDQHSIFVTPLYRSVLSPWEVMSERTLNNYWSAVYEIAGISVEKRTHQNRVQMQQELDAKGLPAGKIRRHCHYADGDREMSKRQQQSYIFTPAWDTVVGCAGGDFRNPKHHTVGWVTSAAHPLCDEIIDFFLPALKAEEERVEKACQNNPSFSQQKELRLVTAKGSIRYFRAMLRQALMMAAARPLLANGSPVLISPAIQERYRSDRNVFDLALFDSDKFGRLTIIIKDAQETHNNG